jgi:hypothetical protein
MMVVDFMSTWGFRDATEEHDLFSWRKIANTGLPLCGCAQQQRGLDGPAPYFLRRLIQELRAGQIHAWYWEKS